jgi:nicotinamidase-related amidase
MNTYTEPHFTSSALITIDTQNDFTLDNAPAKIEGTKEVIPKMVQLLDTYRKIGLPIIHMIRLYLTDGSNVDLCRRQVVEEGKEIAAPESIGSELVSDLKPDSSIRINANELLEGKIQKIGDNEFVMYKPRWGAFYGTYLEEFLNEHKSDTLVFSGCNYPNCPRTSIYEASERDFRVVLAKDAISQLYPKGEEEMRNIGVSLLKTHEIVELLT